MNYGNISSVQCVFDVIDRYGIKSEDFVTRAPNWIKTCLDELKLRENTVTKPYISRFNNNRCLLPIFLKSLDLVVIDGHRCDYNESLYVIDSESSLNREAMFVGDNTSNTGVSNILSIDSNGEVDMDFINSGMPYFYKIDNGWLRTNVSFGTIEIIYKATETVLDPVIGLEFPTIPDEFNTKEAIIDFILMTILMRGYIHPILSLKENNPKTNPSLAYIVHSAKAKIYVARPNIDSRQKWNYPMAALHGVRKPLYIDRNLPVTNTLNVVEASMEYHMSYAICSDEFINSNRVDISYVENKALSVEILPVSGFNYLYISVPSSKTFSVFNQLGLDVTHEFIKIDVDTEVGYYDNTLYRMNNQFYTGVGFQLIIEIK